MLKFLRKYQVFLLAIGGSLLMVVFLIQPVLQNFGFDPRKEKVATIGPALSKVTRGELDRASAEITAVRDVFRGADGAVLTLTLGLEPDRTNEHWYLLGKAAEEAGLVGVAIDGDLWIDQTAAAIAQIQVFQQFLQQFGGNQQFAALMMQQPQTQAQIAQLTQQAADQFRQNRIGTAAQLRASEDQVDEVLAKAAGIARLRTQLNAPLNRFSAPEQYASAAEAARTALADVIILDTTLIEDSIPDPTDEQLRAHVERFENDKPGDFEANDFGIGYTLPPRIKLSYIFVNPTEIEPLIEIDRLELRRLWRQDNPDAPNEQFADQIDRYRRGAVADRLVEVTEVIEQTIVTEFKRQLTTADQGVDGYYTLPAEWPANGIDLNDVTQTVAQTLQDRFELTYTPPVVNIDGWQTTQDLQGLQYLGSASFRVGSTEIPFPQLTQNVRELIDEPTPLAAQTRVPIFEPPATDFAGRQYYIVVEDARRESPADTLDEIRERATEDYKKVLAFEQLQERLPEFQEHARTEGLAGLQNKFTLGENETIITKNLIPSENARIQIGTAQRPAASGDDAVPPTFDFRIAQPAFRDFREEIINAASDAFTVLAEPTENNPILVSGVAPNLPGVAVAQVRAFRPIPYEQFRVGVLQLSLGQADAAERVLDLEEVPDSPLSFASLATRYNYEHLRNDKSETDGQADDNDVDQPAAAATGQ